MSNKNLQKEKESTKKLINEEIDRYYDDEERYKLINKFCEERKKKKQELKEFAENYLILSYPKDKLNEEDLNKYKRFCYYEVAKDCLEFLQATDKDMQFSLTNTCVKK